LARASTPFAIAAGIGVAQMRVPILLLGAFSGDAAVGLYGAAARFSEAVKLVPSGFFGALFPALSQLAGAGASELQYTFRRVESGLLAVGIVSALAFTLAAVPLITLTYGAAFAPAAPILIVFGWTLVPYFWGTMITLYLYAINDESYVNRIRGIGVAVQVALSIPLILSLGALGAALAALVGEIITSILFRRRWAQLRRIPGKRDDLSPPLPLGKGGGGGEGFPAK
jgi:O-antigen/teichoic acid export membrane protein